MYKVRKNKGDFDIHSMNKLNEDKDIDKIDKVLPWKN